MVMRNRCILLLVGLAALGCSQAGQAQADAAPAKVTNTVGCVFDNLSVEDREIALMLIGLGFLEQHHYARIAPPNTIVDRLVQEALPRCRTAFRWSSATSDAAVAYAHSMLVQEVVRQAIEYEGLKIDPVEEYFKDNRSKLADKTELDELMEEDFATHLWQGGWKEATRGGRRLARIYIEVLLARDSTEQTFAKTLTRIAPVKGAKRRLKTTSRGTS